MSYLMSNDWFDFAIDAVLLLSQRFAIRIIFQNEIAWIFILLSSCRFLPTDSAPLLNE